MFSCLSCRPWLGWGNWKGGKAGCGSIYRWGDGHYQTWWWPEANLETAWMYGVHSNGEKSRSLIRGNECFDMGTRRRLCEVGRILHRDGNEQDTSRLKWVEPWFVRWSASRYCYLDQRSVLCRCCVPLVKKRWHINPRLLVGLQQELLKLKLKPCQRRPKSLLPTVGAHWSSSTNTTPQDVPTKLTY